VRCATHPHRPWPRGRLVRRERVPRPVGYRLDGSGEQNRVPDCRGIGASVGIGARRLRELACGRIKIAQIVAARRDKLAVAPTTRQVAAAGQQRLRDLRMLRHEFQIAERTACRGDQGFVAGRLGFGQRGAQIVAGIVEKSRHPVGFTAPREGLRLEIGVADLAGQADRFRPFPCCRHAVADAKGRRASTEIPQNRVAIRVTLRMRHRAGEHRRGERDAEQAPGHFSCISVNTPVSPAARRLM
jgi:hypothetical protein